MFNRHQKEPTYAVHMFAYVLLCPTTKKKNEKSLYALARCRLADPHIPLLNYKKINVFFDNDNINKKFVLKYKL